MKIIDGYMSFKEYKTYYRIAGTEYTELAPLLLLHGGPGSTHNYFEVFDKLADMTKRQIISYDQLGCGNSYIDGKPELWNMETWTEELIALTGFLKLKKFHLLGQSFGGMLLLNYICNCKESENVLSIILSSTLPSSKMWGIEQERMIKQLPLNMQKVIKEATEANDYTIPGYQEAEDFYMELHCFKASENTPECVLRKTKKGREAYVVGWGPNEFTPLGTLKDYDVTGQLKDIHVPALITSGGNDLCTPYIAKYMYDNIPDSQWELFKDAGHMPFVEENDEYLEMLESWLLYKK